MFKRLLLTGLLTIILCLPTIQAQTKSTRENRHAFTLQMPFNNNKVGVGLKYSYDFTKILRFNLESNYYFGLGDNRKFNTITTSGEKGYNYWGRHFDFDVNLNFVFGDGNFHFYLITGLYVSVGYKEAHQAINGQPGITLGNTFYYYKDEVEKVYGVGLGVNLGFGIEYQISEKIRVSLDQQLAAGGLISWMARVGVSYCF